MKNDRAHSPAVVFEAGLVFLATVAFILVQLMPLRSTSMLSRPLWLDECVTDLIVREPDAGKAYREMLAGGVDANPPAYYAMMRGLATFGLHSPAVYRIAAMLCVAAAVAGVYALLRQAFDRFASVVGAMGVWTIPLVIEHSFEARFYGLLLAATVWFAYFALHAGRGRLCKAGLALTAAVACTTHWFGIIGVVLVLTGEGVRRWRSREAGRELWPAIAGPVALLACVPLLLAQRRALGGESFIFGNPLRSAYAFYLMLLPGAAAAVVLCGTLIESLADNGRSREQTHRDLSPLLGLLMLSLMPLCLVAISLALQPVMQLRYAIVAAAAMGVPVAIGAAMVRRIPWRAAVAVGMALVAFHSLFKVWLVKADWVSEVNSVTVAVHDARDRGSPVLFELRHDQYPVVWSFPAVAGSCFFLDEPLPEESRLHGFERVMARRVMEVAGSPQTVDLATAGARFVFIAESNDAAKVMKYFPDAAVEPLGGRVFRVTR